MDAHLDARLSRVIDARRGELSDRRAHSVRRAGRDRLVAELPRFLAKLSGAIGEINDQLSETDVILSLVEQEGRLAAESSLRVRVKDHDADDTWLDVAIDAEGGVHGVIERGGERRSVGEVGLFDVSKDTLADWLIDLLETRYLGRDSRRR